MKAGQTIQDLANNILADANRRRDYVVDTSSVHVAANPRGGLAIDLRNSSRSGAEIESPALLEVTDLCFAQVATHTGVPTAYARRMLTGSLDDRRLLAANFNHWMTTNRSRQMLRTFDATPDNSKPRIARALLSDRFRPLDNLDLTNAILPKLNAAGCIVESVQLTERRLYIQARTPRVEGDVRVGDTMQAGVVISNSEVGCGSLKIEPMLFRLVCSNGLILPNALRRYHVGARREDIGEVAHWSRETHRLTDRALFAQCADTVDAALNDISFRQQLERIREKADGKSVATPPAIVEVLTKKLDLSESESGNVLMHLAAGGSLDIWGVTNAVTRAAEDCEDYDRAVELERAGSLVLEMKPSDFSNN
jgi:hypothetical protein